MSDPDQSMPEPTTARYRDLLAWPTEPPPHNLANLED